MNSYCLVEMYSSRAEKEEVMSSLVYCFYIQGHGPSLVSSLMLNDATVCQKKEVVFIEQSPACVPLTYFYRAVGLEYLWNTLSPIIIDVMKQERHDKSTIEIKTNDASLDYTYEESQDDNEISDYQIQLLAQKIIEKVLKSRSSVPKQIKRFLHITRLGLGQISPDTNIGSSLNNLFFGKFILSSLCSNSYRLFDSMNTYAHSQFMKASKLIRGAISGKTSDSSVSVSTFAANNYDDMSTFLFDLCDDGESYNDSTDLKLPQNESDIEQYQMTLSLACDEANFSSNSFSSNISNSFTSGQFSSNLSSNLSSN